MTDEDIQAITPLEQILVFISQRIGITPAIGLLTQQISLRFTVISVFWVRNGIHSPVLLRIIIFPTIAELRTERPTLKRFPIDTDIIILIKSTALFLCGK